MMELVVSKRMNASYGNGSLIDRSDLPVSKIVAECKKDPNWRFKAHSHLEEEMVRKNPDLIALSKLPGRYRYHIMQNPDKYKIQKVGFRWFVSKEAVEYLQPPQNAGGGGKLQAQKEEIKTEDLDLSDYVPIAAMNDYRKYVYKVRDNPAQNEAIFVNGRWMMPKRLVQVQKETKKKVSFRERIHEEMAELGYVPLSQLSSYHQNKAYSVPDVYKVKKYRSFRFVPKAIAMKFTEKKEAA